VLAGASPSVNVLGNVGTPYRRQLLVVRAGHERELAAVARDVAARYMRVALGEVAEPAVHEVSAVAVADRVVAVLDVGDRVGARGRGGDRERDQGARAATSLRREGEDMREILRGA
jgi:hypothetical protein